MTRKTGKMCRRIFSAVFCGAFLLPSVAEAQSAEGIVKQAAKAMGGERALRRVKTWEAAGVVTRKRDGAVGRFRGAAMRPDLYAVIYEIAGAETGAGRRGEPRSLPLAVPIRRGLKSRGGRDRVGGCNIYFSKTINAGLNSRRSHAKKEAHIPCGNSGDCSNAGRRL